MGKWLISDSERIVVLGAILAVLEAFPKAYVDFKHESRHPGNATVVGGYTIIVSSSVVGDHSTERMPLGPVCW